MSNKFLLYAFGAIEDAAVSIRMLAIAAERVTEPRVHLTLIHAMAHLACTASSYSKCAMRELKENR